MNTTEKCFKYHFLFRTQKKREEYFRRGTCEICMRMRVVPHGLPERLVAFSHASRMVMENGLAFTFLSAWHNSCIGP